MCSVILINVVDYFFTEMPSGATSVPWLDSRNLGYETRFTLGVSFQIESHQNGNFENCKLRYNFI